MITSEIECGADALRRFEQGGKQLRDWAQLPKATKAKWIDKVKTVLAAVERERNRLSMGDGQ